MATVVVLSFLSENAAYNDKIGTLVAITPAFVTQHSPVLRYMQETHMRRKLLQTFVRLARLMNESDIM